MNMPPESAYNNSSSDWANASKPLKNRINILGGKILKLLYNYAGVISATSAAKSRKKFDSGQRSLELAAGNGDARRALGMGFAALLTNSDNRAYRQR